MLPSVKVWCLPEQTEEQLHVLHHAIVEVFRCIPELGITREQDLVVLFPSDMMRYGLGSEILVEISLSEGPLCTFEVRRKIVQLVNLAVSGQFPGGIIQSQLTTFNPNTAHLSRPPA